MVFFLVRLIMPPSSGITTWCILSIMQADATALSLFIKKIMKAEYKKPLFECYFVSLDLLVRLSSSHH